MLLAQNLILMGVFFTVPLYLQVVQGLDALETGVRMLPLRPGSSLPRSAAQRFRRAARPLVRAGLVVTFLSTLLLLGVIEPELDDASFLLAMGAGDRYGSDHLQLGNVAQSSVTDGDRSEAGGLQNTAQLGSSLGTALLGAVVITGLITAFTNNVASDPRVSTEAEQQIEIRIASGVSFISADEVRTAATEGGAEPEEVDALVEGYEDAQLNALKTAFLFAGFIVLASFLGTRRIPAERLVESRAGPDAPNAQAA